MRTVLPLILCAALFLAGCEGIPAPTQSTAPTRPTEAGTQRSTPAAGTPAARTPVAETAVPTHAPTLNPVEVSGTSIQFWHPWNGAAGQAMQALAMEFNRSNEFGVTVEARSLDGYDALYRAVNEALAAGAPPHLSAAHAYQVRRWQEESDSVVDLNPYLADAQYGLAPGELQDFFPQFSQREVSGEKRLGLPALLNAQVMIYNKTWGKALGFEALPESTQAFREQSCAANRSMRLDQNTGNDGLGGWVVNEHPISVLSWLYAFGSQPETARGYQFDSAESAQALGFLKGLADGVCAWVSEADFPEVRFAQRETLLITSSLMDLPYIAAAMQRAENTDAWTAAGFPDEAGAPFITAYGPAYTVFQTTEKEQLAAWLFVRWLSRSENQARFAAASGGLPVRATAMDYLGDYAAQNPQWAQIAALLPSARTEPSHSSWSLVRWALLDVGTQTFRSYFQAERIPETLQLLDETAAELQSR